MPWSNYAMHSNGAPRLINSGANPALEVQVQPIRDHRSAYVGNSALRGWSEENVVLQGLVSQESEDRLVLLFLRKTLLVPSG